MEKVILEDHWKEFLKISRLFEKIPPELYESYRECFYAGLSEMHYIMGQKIAGSQTAEEGVEILNSVSQQIRGYYTQKALDILKTKYSN